MDGWPPRRYGPLNQLLSRRALRQRVFQQHLVVLAGRKESCKPSGSAFRVWINAEAFWKECRNGELVATLPIYFRRISLSLD
jgi:hypothetical protein